MWRSNFVNYLTVILTLAILYQGVKAQNGFNGFFDSYIRDQRDINTEQQISPTNYYDYANQFWPSYENNLYYPTYQRPENQFNPTNQQSGYRYDEVYQQPETYSSSEANQPYKTPSSGIPEFAINSRRETANNLERKSKQKCEEYSKLATQTTHVTSLSILPSTMKINTPTCTFSTGLIVGGEITNTGEFPHMAAIGLRYSGKISWVCGGSLISEYFVLTAAHCKSVDGRNVDVVRLGDQNLIRRDDNAKEQDYTIANFLAHPDYKFRQNYYDIALIRLNRRVVFAKYIRPACLWQNDYINSKTVVATGWGRTDYSILENSDDLRKVSLDIIDNNDCNQLYQDSELKNGIVRSQMCAGHLPGGKDTCLGDSGGPIQVVQDSNKCIFHIVGITSFGKACGILNSAGVYTRVSSYLDWIEKNVWP